MQLKPVRRVSISKSVANQLLDMIREGSLLPGDQIPPERELVERLAVGRSSVREALQILSTLNVIHVTPGSGAVVKELQPSDVFRADLIGVLIGKSMAAELLEAREMLEPSSARLACLRGTQADFAKIEDLLMKHERALTTGEPINEHAAEFHVLVARAARNRDVISFMESILEILKQGGRKVSRIPNFARQELEEHREIFEILKRRDEDLAYKLMRQHIIKASATYDDHVVEGEGGVYVERVINPSN